MIPEIMHAGHIRIALLVTGLAGILGCSSPPAPSSFSEPAPAAGTNAAPAIREIYLTPGDEIRISVYGQPDLTRQSVIPPDGRLYFPLAGELDVSGMSVRGLREAVASKLAATADYAITPGDEVAVRVYRHDDLSVEGIVPQNGMLALPLGGEVRIGGLTAKDAGEAVTRALAPYVVKPVVSVRVLRYQGGLPIGNPQVSVDLIRLTGEKYFVLGYVRTPGVFAHTGQVRLLDAIALAGGLLPDAKDSKILLMRPGNGKTPAESVTIDINDSLKRGDPAANPALQRGDIVYVPETALSQIGRVFAHIRDITEPLLDIETGIWLGQSIEAGPVNQNRSQPTTVILSK